MPPRATYSVCPTCLQRIPAQRVSIGREIFLHKTCPDHGSFETILWRGHRDLEEWVGPEGTPLTEPPCPEACGLCPGHLQQTCCVLLEVTQRCNLNCRFCFAGGAGAGEPSFQQIQAWLVQLAVPGKTLVQLSGGEPTLRDDLPEIVAAAKQAGCRYVQLNTNGLRLAEDEPYVKALAEAGLSFVFLQFDGTEDAIYEQLRGRPLLRIKQRAIEACAARNIGVTLVPTLVPGINIGNIGAILRFGIAQAPAVRGVHFQPVSHFWHRPADEMRFTLDELLMEIDKQAGNLVKAEQLLPSRCDHPLCGFHGDFLVAQDGQLVPLSQPKQPGTACCCSPATADQNRAFVARRWLRPQDWDGSLGGTDLRDMDTFLRRVQTHGFTITAMAFQDAGNLDLERLRRCSLHVFDQGRFVPFCAYYLSEWEP